MTKTDEQKLDAFLHKSLRRLFKIYWPMRVTNEEIRARAGLETISKQVARRRWAWLGHVLRMDHYSHPRIALTWVPEGKRKRGRPRETWRRTIKRELKENGLGTWAAAASGAEDRTAWRQSLQPNSPLGEWINDRPGAEQFLMPVGPAVCCSNLCVHCSLCMWC